MNISQLVGIIEDVRAREGDIEVRFMAPYNDYEIEQITLTADDKGKKYLRLEWQQG